MARKKTKLMSKARDLEELISIVSDKAYREHWAYLMKREVLHNRLILSFACPTDYFLELQATAKRKTKLKDMLEYKDMFTLDHIKVNLCNFLEPRKSEKLEHWKTRKEIIDEMTK